VNEKRIELRHEGMMRFVAATGSGHEVAFDDRDGNTGMRPTEGVLTALVACAAMDVASILDKKRQQPYRYAVHLHSVQRDEYPQVFTAIEIVHEVEGREVTVDGVRRCIELSATKYCPVSAILSASPATLSHRYKVRTGPEEEWAEGEVIVTGPNQPAAILPD
jgi:putative redox protein